MSKNEVEELETVEEETENEALVRRLKVIAVVVKFIFYIGAVLLACLGLFIGAEQEGVLLPCIISGAICFLSGLITTSFIEWLAQMLETVDKIKEKLEKK